MTSPRARGWAAGLVTNAFCAALFWTARTVAGPASVVSFWNRPTAVSLALTGLYIVFGARAQIWYARKLEAYARRWDRGPVRLLPLAFGLGVFGAVVTWLAVTIVAEASFRGYRLLFSPSDLDRTVLLLPFVFFIQFLFSPSTLVWLLAAGVTWPLASRTEPLRGWFLCFRRTPSGTPDVPGSVAFLKLWNLLGYMIFILSLLMQS